VAASAATLAYSLVDLPAMVRLRLRARARARARVRGRVSYVPLS